MSREELTFDEWYNLYEDEIMIELAENGADREMDFDLELEFEIRYQNYLNQNNVVNKEAIEFHRWMMVNDTIENAETYFHWSDEDMFKEFLKQQTLKY